MSFPEQVKSNLLGIISQMAAHPEDFSKHPGSDFSRKRRLDFSTLLHLFISMEAGTIKDELLNYFSFNTSISHSAFYQQRAKLSETALPHLFHSFNKLYPCDLYKGKVTVQNPCLLQDDLSVPSKSSCQSFISADTVLPACANV